MRLAFVAFVALASWPEVCRSARVNCDDKVGDVMNDLNDLRTANEDVNSLCQASADDPYNLDTKNKRFPGGDCEQTYRVINALGERVEGKLEEACQAFNEGATCSGRDQQTQFSCTSSKYRLAGLKVRQGLALLRKAEKILKKRVGHNRDDIDWYGKLGGFDPDGVMGGQPSSVTGDGRRYFELAREQASSMLKGSEFISKAQPVAKKLDYYQAKLNSMGATAGLRSQNMGQVGSTISGSTNKVDALSQVGSGLASFGNQAAPDSSAAGKFRDEDFLLKPGEGELSDDQFFDALEGKPFGEDLAAKMPGEAGFTAKAQAAKEDEYKKSQATGTAADSGAVSGLSLASSKLAGDNAEGNFGRMVASVPSKPGGTVAGSDMTSASSPGFNSRGKEKAQKEPNEALANYASMQGKVAPAQGSGPSLREMLRQRMNGGGGATRAMHEVLGGMKELGGEAGEGTQAAGGDLENSSREEIKGIDSEPLFVRVRAAHVRFQRVRVSDI